jgi:hypothetical protein
MVFNLLPVITQPALTTLVPEWFYLYSGLIYLLAASISFLVSYFSFKLFRITSSKSQSALSIAFILIGLGFALLSAVSIFTYQDAHDLDTDIFNINSNVYNAYYILTLVAYLFLVMIYLPKKNDAKFYLFVPLWFISAPQFHTTALLFFLFIAARSVLNFFKVKTQDAFLVMLAFLMITLFHIFLLLIPFGIELYLAAHAFLIVGFLSLLAMLVRVSRK